MIRKGKYKFNYLGKGDQQLFDFENDPEEWNNLIGKAEYKEIEEELKSLILSHFDPEQIDKKAEENIEKRWVIRRTHENYPGPGWNFTPDHDVDHAYWRSEGD